MSKDLNQVIGNITSYRSLNNVLGEISRLNREQIRNLINAVQEDGDIKAIEKLSFNYFRMIGKLADGFSHSDEHFQELFQAACIGMIESFHSFNQDKSTQLSTYVTIYAKKEIYKFIQENHRIVNIAKYGSRQSRLFYNIDKHTDEDGVVDVDTLSTLFNIPKKRVEEYVIVRKATDMSIDMVSDNEDDFHKVQLGTGEDTNLERIFTEGTEHLPYQQKAIEKALDKLPPKNSKVIIERWLSGEDSTLDEIAKKMNYSRQHIHTLENNALKSLRKILKREDV